MSRLLIDGRDLLAIFNALYGNGDLSAISTEALETFADSQFGNAAQIAKVRAEIEKRAKS